MCGRYSLKINNDFQDRYQLSTLSTALKSNNNIAPSQTQPVIIKSSDNISNQLKMMRWGITPSWSTTGKELLFNARAEGINEKITFKHFFRNNRCLIPATGFYEWQKNQGNSIPYYFYLEHNQYFSMAGIYDDNHSFTIITTSPNDIMTPIHHRMPVILNQNMEDQWLNNHDYTFLQTLLKPYEQDDLKVKIIQ